MPGTVGLEALDAVCNTFDAPVIMLSGEDDAGVIRRVIDHGASGFIPKTSTPRMLDAALQLILAGGIYLPPEALASEPEPEPETGLTERQQQVVLKAVQGKANKVIARELHIAEGTVKAHLSSAYKTLGAANRTEAVYLAAKMGLKVASND